MNPRTFIFCLTLCLPALGQAQVTLPVNSAPVAASADNSRLRQMETIYQLQLRSRHIPLLSGYITDLQKLAAQAADPAPYQKEIERVQGIISSGGVMDLAAAVQSLKTPSEAPVPQSLPMPARVPRGVMALTPALARSITPTPDGSASPEAAAIGEMEWRIETLPAGTYEVLLNYACTALEKPLPVQVMLGGYKVEGALDAGKTTPDTTTYRLLRLGQITLPTDVRGETLRLTAGAKGSNALLLRQLMITRAKAAVN